METFADRLKAAMNEQGLKQVDLVRLAQQKGIKLGKSHVSQYVSGKTIPRTDILHFLADALQVDPDWLNNNNDNDSTLSDVDKIQTSADNSGGMKVREFKKSSKLNNVLYDVRGPVVDEASADPENSDNRGNTSDNLPVTPEQHHRWSQRPMCQRSPGRVKKAELLLWCIHGSEPECR